MGQSQITAVDIPDANGTSTFDIWVYDWISYWSSAGQDLKSGSLHGGESYKVKALVAMVMVKDGVP